MELPSKERIYEVRKLYNLHQPGAMEQAVDILEDWVKKQTHFTKTDFDREYLERMIIFSKGSVERAKEKMEKSCTLRTLHPHMFEPFDLRESLKTDLKHLVHASMPKMTKDNKRVYLARNLILNNEPTSVMTYSKCLIMGAEYIKHYDYSAGTYVILDMMDCGPIDFANRIYVQDYQMLYEYMHDAYGHRVDHLYIISDSKVINIAVKGIKQILSDKLATRITLLKDRCELVNFFDKEIIPEDYGGTEKPLAEIQGAEVDMLMSAEVINQLRAMNSARTDESKRQRSASGLTDTILPTGLPGTFRTLTID